MRHIIFLMAFWLALFPGKVPYAAPGQKVPSSVITIYSKASPGSVPPEAYRPAPGQALLYTRAFEVPGYAVIKERRVFDLSAKLSTVSVRDVAAYIDPTTVTFSSLSYPKATTALEQNYWFDLVNNQKLLERYIDKIVTVQQVKGDNVEEIKGKLLSAADGLILEQDDGKIVALKEYATLFFPEIPGGLITRPTLNWLISTNNTGKHDVEISYQTTGMTWWADYNAVFTEGKNANTGMLDINAWVSIINRSGASYKNSKLKLIAGDVHRATPGTPRHAFMKAEVMMAADTARGFEEKAFSEYHLYTLGRLVNIPDNSAKQLELFPSVHKVPVTKKFIYRAHEGSKVGVYLVLQNTKDNQLGIPLPAGRIRVNQKDTADGSLEFIGEDIIDHTPKDEELTLNIGNAFDVTGKRTQISYNQRQNENWAEEEVEFSIKNHKKEDVEVIVEEYLRGYSNWDIEKSSHDYKKKSANVIEFPITVPKDKEVKVKYKIEYKW